MKGLQYWSLLNWRKIRFWCGCVAVLVNWIFVIIVSCFAIFKNVEHSLKPGETPSTSPGSKLYTTHLNITKYFKTVRCGCFAFIFSVYLNSVLYRMSVLGNYTFQYAIYMNHLVCIHAHLKYYALLQKVYFVTKNKSGLLKWIIMVLITARVIFSLV